MLVDLEVILVKGLLPVLCLSVVEGGCSFIGGQCRISLSPAEVGFVGWSVRCPVVLVDVQRRDSLEDLCIQRLCQVLEPFPLPWIGPCFPHHAKLHDHIGGSEGELGQGDQPLEQGAGFGLGTWCHARDGAFPQEGSKGEGMDAESKHPGLGPLVIRGWGGVEGDCQP